MPDLLIGVCREIRSVVYLIASVTLVAMLPGVRPVFAQTYISSEPIPSEQIVGTANLSKIVSIGYPNLELWSERLVKECKNVQNVIDVLTSHGAIRTITAVNTRYIVAAGGFEGTTNPSYVLTIENSGRTAANAADIYVLNNALGYVLNQSGTAQFSIPFDKRNPFEFALEYAVVTYAGTLRGVQAKQFFDYLGTIDPELWTGTNAGFTQINFGDSAVNNFLLNNSMLFLIGSVPKQQFIQGLFQAATTASHMTYWPLAENGKPTVEKAGVAFPGNDWSAFPAGQEYLSNLGNASPQLLTDLARLRQQHLQAAMNLLRAIESGNVRSYLRNQFQCP